DFSQPPRPPVILPLHPRPITYGGVWRGRTVSLLDVPNVDFASLADAVRAGTLAPFQTNDRAFRCLRGATLQVWRAPEFPGSYLAQGGGTGTCAQATWVFPPRG